jgi:hypothetical protein
MGDYLFLSHLSFYFCLITLSFHAILFEEFKYSKNQLTIDKKIAKICVYFDRLCGLVIRVLGYRFGGPGSIPGTTKKKKWVWNGVHSAS